MKAIAKRSRPAGRLKAGTMPDRQVHPCCGHTRSREFRNSPLRKLGACASSAALVATVVIPQISNGLRQLTEGA